MRPFTLSRTVAWLFASLTILAVLLGGSSTTAAQSSDEPDTYTITITNQTHGQLFSPPLVFSHKKKITAFETGQPSSLGISSIAEGGDPNVLADIMRETDGVLHVTRSPVPPMQPGETRSLTLLAGGGFNYVTVVAMLNPTNDAFIAIQGARIPGDDKPVVFHANAYDAGSEPNDELCINIAGPICALINGSAVEPVLGEGKSPDVDGEGFIHVHGGIHGVGDLSPDKFDWKNPAAKITVQRGGELTIE